jgi:ribose transport system substrate-binding protein
MNMNTLRRNTIIGAAALFTLLGTGCGRDEQGTKTAEQPPKTFAMNVLVSGVPFFSDTQATWSAMGAGLNVKTVYGGPLDTDAQKQIQQIEALIAQKVDGLVIAPTDSAALAPVINSAVDRGIPVITYLNDVPASKRLAYVTSEREDASMKVGHLVIGADVRPSKAIIMYAQPGNDEQEARRRGFELLAKEKPNLKVVAVVSDKFDEAVGAAQLRPLLAKYPDVNYIFGCGSRSAVGAVSALKELNFKPGQVTVTGWDYDADVLNLISQGWVKVTAAQNTPFMTQIAFNILKARAGGWLYPTNRQFQENGVRPIPEKIVVQVDLVTESNLKGYYPRPSQQAH